MQKGADSKRGERKKSGERGERENTEFNLSSNPLLFDFESFPAPHFPGSTPAPLRLQQQDDSLLNTPVLGEYFASSGATPAATPVGPAKISAFPGKKAPQIYATPIQAQPRAPIPTFDNRIRNASLVAQIKDLEQNHSIAMRKKDLEIHYLRCGLSSANPGRLQIVNSLIAGKNIKGWVQSEDLPKVTDMNAGEVVHEINVRGQQQRLDFNPEKPPVKHDASGVQPYLKRPIIGRFWQS